MAAVFVSAFAGVLVADRDWRTRGLGAAAVDAVCCLAVVGLSFGYFLWLASPSLLPITNGPDVVHHLMLIDLIQRTHHLPHDPALLPYLVEMSGYTPGSHILTATAASLLRLDAVRVVHAVAAAFAALGLGIIYLIALRLLPARPWSRLLAFAAPLLALVASVYTLGAFFDFFFLSQIVSETFALAMLLAVIDWARGGRDALVRFAACGVAVLFTWPVWIGPPIVALVVAAMFLKRSRDAWRHGAYAVLPLVAAAAVHAAVHPGAGGILASAGAVTKPSIAGFGIGLLLSAAAGAVVCCRRTAASLVIVFLVAVAAQAFSLALLARIEGSRSLYMAFKMAFLAVPPLAVLGCAGLGFVAEWIAVRVPYVGGAARAAALIGVCLMLGGRLPMKRQHGSITEPALQAGEWARGHLPTACIDYFSSYWLTGYWLHLDVLGNPRLSDRMRAESFEFRDAAGKWIEGRGLPYAFVEDFDAIPRDARVDMAIVQRFGRAALVRNLRPATCTDSSPSLWQLTRGQTRTPQTPQSQSRGQTPRRP